MSSTKDITEKKKELGKREKCIARKIRIIFK
jgi:hypothetical protein